MIHDRLGYGINRPATTICLSAFRNRRRIARGGFPATLFRARLWPRPARIRPVESAVSMPLKLPRQLTPADAVQFWLAVVLIALVTVWYTGRIASGAIFLLAAGVSFLYWLLRSRKHR